MSEENKDNEVADMSIDNPLVTLSPLDGRYKRNTLVLRNYFS